MRIPIRNKLIITYFMISTFTALLIYLLTYFTSEQRINALAKNYQTNEMVKEIAHWYAAEQKWDGFAEYFMALHPPRPNKEQNKVSAQEDEKLKRHGLLTHEYKALLNYRHFQRGEIVSEAYLINAIPVSYKKETIAWIIPPDVIGLSLNSEMQVFLDNIQEVLLIAISIGIFISLLMGIVLAKIVLKPVELLTKASSAIAAGKLQQKVNHYGNDEIGDLSRSFNKMSLDLFYADKQRRQLTADITHDLGTPIQVISGYIEMAQEGGFQITDEYLETISTELGYIKRLIKDMGLLAETDARTLSLQLTKTRIQPLLQRVIRIYQQASQEKCITLSLDTQEPLPIIELDEERIVQVLGNLINNAMRYTSEGGEIKIKAEADRKQLCISVIDNGSGIQAQDLPFIFDRFYQSDSTRNGTSGKMGLGLSISQGLIEMQGGEISVKSDGMNGSCFKICFPVK